MDEKLSAYRGCLWGLAVGDAMGYTVDLKSWEEICNNYGPAGLLGYDLANGNAEITSHTQLAAYIANSLLAGVTRGRPEAYTTYAQQALREWAKRQYFPRDPAPSRFWVARLPELRRRHCRDARLPDILRGESLGTPERPVNKSTAPGSLTTGVAVGVFFQPKRISPLMLGTLAAEISAMTHGDPEAFLSAAVLAYAVAGVLQAPEYGLKEQFIQAYSVVEEQFGEQFSLKSIQQLFQKALELAETEDVNPREAMESLACFSAGSCLAGAVYASITNEDDFDGGIICAVNHSGASAAVGAVTGAILGARLGVYALPDFYIESLDCIPALTELADDLAQGSITAGLFDTDWDQKYVHGIPIQPPEEE